LQDLLRKDSDSFTIPVKIIQNGCLITISALIDTGANGFAFIDTNLTTLICQCFEIQTIPLGAECAVRGYNR
jgi:predicted aspartyl protease